MKRLLALLMIGALLTAGSGCGEGTSESTRVEGSAAAGRHVNKQQRAERRRAARRHRARVRTQRAAIRHARRAAAHRQRQADQARAHQRALVAAEAQAAKEAAAEEEASECDPNYAGACLNPYSSDYDCEGGSGNGPDYTGEVTVVGEDHYGLDADSDGIGCEPY